MYLQHEQIRASVPELVSGFRSHYFSNPGAVLQEEAAAKGTLLVPKCISDGA